MKKRAVASKILAGMLDLATVIRFGPEGDGWTDQDGDGIFEDGVKNAGPSNRWWYHWYGWYFGSIIVSKYPEGYPSGFGQLVREFNNNSNQESNLGFIFHAEPVANEIAACNNVVSEYAGILKAGQSDDVDRLVDEFIQKLKDNGSDAVVEEAQRQLAHWRACVGKSAG